MMSVETFKEGCIRVLNEIVRWGPSVQDGMLLIPSLYSLRIGRSRRAKRCPSPSLPNTAFRRDGISASHASFSWPKMTLNGISTGCDIARDIVEDMMIE